MNMTQIHTKTISPHHEYKNQRAVSFLGASFLLAILISCTTPSMSYAGQKVWLLAGQSNMVGWGTKADDLPAELQQIQTDVEIFTGTNWNYLAPMYGNEFGPEVSFGYEMSQALPDDEVLLIKSTFGLGNLYNHWRSPNTGRGPAGEHYANYMALVANALASKPDAEIAGMIWMQGEGDGYDDLTMATTYRSNLELFISSIRSDLNCPDLPFVIGQITYSNAWMYGDIVRQAQADVTLTVDNCYLVTTGDIFLSDNMHYTSAGQVDLGKRFAEQALIAIPEPATMAVLALGGSLAMIRRKRG